MTTDLIVTAILAFAWGVLAGCWLRTRQIKAWPALYGLRRGEGSVRPIQPTETWPVGQHRCTTPPPPPEGVTPELRKAYEFYKQNFHDR